ncbi:hypothetical protein NLG97_g2197 [Lecanicillium saksenae]|uniref:Uncharacterized protein n=1 Tax=Lecanicillium saksenae TaxID=468837 RepID=A0ACC1R2Z8_9HYPO|nr:hypothetical protein NLG97_g2197 [Lecanicillium saksenae]
MVVSVGDHELAAWQPSGTAHHKASRELRLKLSSLHAYTLAAQLTFYSSFPTDASLGDVGKAEFTASQYGLTLALILSVLAWPLFCLPLRRSSSPGTSWSAAIHTMTLLITACHDVMAHCVASHTALPMAVNPVQTDIGRAMHPERYSPVTLLPAVAFLSPHFGAWSRCEMKTQQRDRPVFLTGGWQVNISLRELSGEFGPPRHHSAADISRPSMCWLTRASFELAF